MTINNLFRTTPNPCGVSFLFLRTFVLSSLLFAFANTADAAMVYGTSADGELIGSRTVADPGLTTTDPADWGDAEISWVISDNGNGTLHYEYTFSGFNKPDIGHVEIDISDDTINGDALVDLGVVTGATLNDAMIPRDKIEFGDFHGVTGVVKFDINIEDENETVLTYAFDSNRSAVYGHIVFKGGQELMNNTGLADPSSMDILDFIPRPSDSVLSPVPEPNCLVLFALAAMTAAGGLRWRP